MKAAEEKIPVYGGPRDGDLVPNRGYQVGLPKGATEPGWIPSLAWYYLENRPTGPVYVYRGPGAKEGV